MGGALKKHPRSAKYNCRGAVEGVPKLEVFNRWPLMDTDVIRLHRDAIHVK
jgi:hypothetical protein